MICALFAAFGPGSKELMFLYAAVRSFRGGSEIEGRSWCHPFLSIGLESDFRRLADQWPGPSIDPLRRGAFNVVLTLPAVWLVFGGVLFDVNLDAGSVDYGIGMVIGADPTPSDPTNVTRTDVSAL